MKASRDARACAIEVLLRVDSGESVQAALHAVLNHTRTDPRDAALCTELVYGFLRTEIRLQAILSHLLRNPSKLPREMLLSIGLAAYSLLFLNRIPPHAAVDSCVRQVRRRHGASLSRVANGVLRSLQRLGAAPLERDFYNAPGRSSLVVSSLFNSVPVWVASLWADAYGQEHAELLLRRSSLQPHAALRVNAQKPDAEPLLHALLRAGGLRCGVWGVAFAPGTQPREVLGQTLDHWHAQGGFSWQAAGSQEALALVGQWGSPVWDACAGQGGKSLALLEQGVEVGLCSDVDMPRLRQLRATALRLGLPVPDCVCASLLAPPVAAWQGHVLLDVPCSGLGTLARRPDIGKHRRLDDVRVLVRLQANILQAAWSRLKPGATLVYMTCTLNPEENELQVKRFLQSHEDAVLQFQWQTPHDHPWLEGMFLARLEKRMFPVKHFT